jgi:hypothetical protein
LEDEVKSKLRSFSKEDHQGLLDVGNAARSPSEITSLGLQHANKSFPMVYSASGTGVVTRLKVFL